MNSPSQIVYAKKDIDVVALQMAKLVLDCSIFTFTGTLGVGKTTLIRSLLAALGVTETVTSPTFTYVQLYHTAEGRKVYHFDLYRIDTPDAFFTAGFDEYLYDPEALVFIEWPEVIIPFIKAPACYISIEHKTEDDRILCFEIMRD